MKINLKADLDETHILNEFRVRKPVNKLTHMMNHQKDLKMFSKELTQNSGNMHTLKKFKD